MSSRPERIYRRLLALLLPDRLRREAQAELLEVFLDAHARTSPRGLVAGTRFWLRMIADLIVTSAVERTRTRHHPYTAALDLPPRSPVMSFRQSLLQVLSDVRLALRRLARTPGWTIASAGTLAFGLAASVVGAVLVRDVVLKPLPFPEPDRLVRIVEVSENGRRWWPSFPNAADWREHGRLFTGVGIADIPAVRPVILDGRAVRVPVSQAARGLFETLGVRPIAGRFFTPDENRPGGSPVAVVSEAFWRQDLRAQPLEGLALTLGSDRYTIVGVLPGDFRFLGDGGAWTEPAAVWTPMDRDTNLGSRTTHGYHVVARLRDGLSLEEAGREMNRLTQTLKAQTHEPTNADTALLTPLQELVVRKAREPLQWLLYAAAALLLVSCLNLAGAVLAQGLGRGRELSVRLALGATRLTIARHLLIEAAMLALPAALLAWGLAAASLHVIRLSGAGSLPRLDEAALDGQAIGLAFGLAIATACLSGIVPALVLSRTAVGGELRTRDASAGSRHHRRLWTGFITVEVALTMLLLCGSGLLIRSFVAALSVDLGYDPHRVLSVDVALPESSYGEAGRRLAFYDAALERLRGTAGLQRVGLTSELPHTTSAYTSGTQRQGDDSRSVMAGLRLVDAGYFDALGIAHLEGNARAFAEGAVIDRRLRDALWNGASPIGDRVSNGFGREPLPVTAVVGTVREWDQGDETTGAVYVDFHRRPDRLQSMHLVVRFTGSAENAGVAVRQALAGVDPLVPVTITPLDALATASMGSRRLLLVLASGFGAMSLLLAGAGIYAMVTFVVTRQLRESAIRLALGAHPRALRLRVIRRGLAPVAGGVIVGLAAAWPAAGAIRAQLFNVRPSDPGVLAAAAVTMVAAAILASLLPARRVVRVNPADAFRQE